MIKLFAYAITAFIGGIFGWAARGWHDDKQPVQQNVHLPTDQEVKEFADTFQNILAEEESPPEDLPDEIEIPTLPFQADEAVEAEDREDDEDPFWPARDAPPVETITEDQYNENYLGYSKDKLLYYSKIDELTFGDEDRVDDKQSLVGDFIQVFFDELGPVLTDTIYVRNNRIGIDFEIERKDGIPYWYDGGEP